MVNHHCEVCDVDIPDGPDAVEIHESGQKHVRTHAQRESMAALAERSVFVKVEGSCLNSERVKQIFEKYGTVDRVLCKSDAASSAIVEMQKAESAQKIIGMKKDTVEEGLTLRFSPREVRLSTTAAVEAVHIDVGAVVGKVQLAGGTFMEQLMVVAKEIAMDEAHIAKRTELCTRLETELSKFFTAPKVQVFGSSITGLGTTSSDMDACVLFESESSGLPFGLDMGRDKFTLLTCDPQHFKGRRVQGTEVARLSMADRARFVCKVLNEVRKETTWLSAQRPVLDARCPIVRFVADKSILVDLSVDNRLGCAKSEYLRDLVLTDSSGKLRIFLLAFRFWAYANGLFETPANQHKGQFNAYMLYLMAISFMQHEGIIPRFSQSSVASSDSGWRIDYSIPTFTLESIDIPTLFQKMFAYLVQFDVSTVLNLRADPVLLELFKKTAQSEFKYGFINMQDPLELAHNVCQNLCQKSLARMRQKMMFALAALKKNKDSFITMLCLDDSRPASSVSHTHEMSFHSKCECEIAKGYSTSTVSSIVSRILETVLGLTTEDVGPEVKRLRMDEEERNNDDVVVQSLGVFSTQHKLWIGRRNLKRQMAKELKLQGIQLESEVSRKLISQEASSETVLQVEATIHHKDNQLTVGFNRLAGTVNDLNDMTHFLEVLMPKFMEELLPVQRDNTDVEMA